MQTSHAVGAWTFEPAREGDLEELLRIHTASFPDARGRDDRVANFCDNPRGGFERLFVVREQGLPIAHAFLFRLETAVAGALVPFGGVATVGVAPEHRGRGVGAFLLECLHAAADREGLLGSFLYAFRQGFYRRFGYGRTSLRGIIDAHPASFVVGPHVSRVRPARTDDDFGRIAQVHRAALLRGTLGHARSEKLWSLRRAVWGREWLLAEREGQVVGYLQADRVCAEVHGPVTLDVRDLVTLDADAETALYAWLSAQRDQVQRVVHELAAADLEALELVDPDRHRFGTAAIEHPLGTVALGPMVRVSADLGAFFARRAWPMCGTVTVARPGDTSSPRGVWRLSVTEAGVSVETLDAGAAADVEGSQSELSSLLAGGVALRDLRAIRLRTHAALDLERFFALPPARPTDAF